MTKHALSRLSNLLKQSGMSQKDLADRLGIKNSAISQWTKIPHNRISQMTEIFDLTSDDIDILLGNQPLEFHYRTKNRKEFYKHTVSEDVKRRTEFIYEIFVSSYMRECERNFDELRSKLSSFDINKKEDAFIAAEIIREEFNIPRKNPISRDFVIKYILEDLGIRSYFMSFRRIGLHLESTEGDLQSAILFNKENKYGILIDADRNWAPSFFDELHEIIHIMFGDIFERGDQLESFIDKIVGELIYPKAFLKKLFVSPDSTSGRIGKTPDQVIDIFIEKYKNDRIWCPSGLAKALIDYSMLTKDSKIYKALTGEFYDFYKHKAKKVSDIGKIDVDHSSFSKHQKLFAEVIEKDPNFYPVYIDLRKKLVTGEVSPNDYADLFGMKVSEVKVLKSIWAEKQLDDGEMDQWHHQ